MGRGSEAQLADSSCQWMNDALIIIKKKSKYEANSATYLLIHLVNG
jgi:hypothetical protein